MSNTHSHLSLVNNSRETAEFTIRPSGDFIQRVIVPSSESRHMLDGFGSCKLGRLCHCRRIG